ncbi:MAG: YeeE/YedE family protein [Epsilonproteobacteria bacterium]|nr:MAG: YeeE/YedE family protein [Campylobacterota bacterium]RLA65309.1 MAG: YeeE/YedE family protein [Campylobacterota bacterium]
MHGLVALLSGIIFSLGLGISGMVNPNVVIGFLDIFGTWNPALVFVMGGAVMVNLGLFNMIIKRKKTYSGGKLHLPTNSKLDKSLIIGSVLFGMGWGIAGICPGPAVANIFLLNPITLTFVGSMLGGMLIYKFTLGKNH